MSKIKVYVVRGYSGEYEFTQTWVAKAFFNKDSADALMTDLNDWCIKNNVSHDTDKNINWYDTEPCPLDKNFACTYTGTYYHIVEIEVEDTP